jgi:predicted nucleotidyltransferase
MKEFLYNRNPMLVLSYLSRNKQVELLYGSKIASEAGINQGGASVVLKAFEKMGIVNSQRAGKTLIYNVNNEHPLIKSFRVFENLAELNGLVEEIKPLCKKIILFGSCATGNDTIRSDIDLFVLANDGPEVRGQIDNYNIDREIKPVIVSPLELVELQTKDQIFWREIEKGIELWGG